MKRAYHQVLPLAFRLFSLKTAVRTALPTASYYVRRPALPPSDKPALFTMNILPPMMTVWHHLAKKYLGDAVDVTIFDCSGTLDPTEFPGARVQKFLNFYAATKSDEFLYHVAKNRKIGWICDDDVFFLSKDILPILQKELDKPKTASVSFKPRTWWQFAIDGKNYQPSGSYCTAFNREIFCEKEHLTLAPANGNTHPTTMGKDVHRYDTGDKANEILLQKGYRCAIAPDADQERLIAAFSGLSGAVILLDYFKTPEEIMTYFREPPIAKWRATQLFGLLSSMLAICTMQECYQELRGKPYPLPSLPKRAALEQLRDEREGHLREGYSFKWIDDLSAKLKKAL